MLSDSRDAIPPPMRNALIAALLLVTPAALASDQPKPPPVPVPGTRLEPWTNGRYIVRDASGRQTGTMEPYPNGWIIRDTTGRETGRVQR